MLQPVKFVCVFSHRVISETLLVVSVDSTHTETSDPEGTASLAEPRGVTSSEAGVSAMAGPSASLEALEALQAHVLVADSAARDEYTICTLDCSSSEGATLCHLIPIAVIDSKLLVAVPHSAWNRTVAKRFLPAKALGRPVAVEVPGVSPADESYGEMKLWFGFLASELLGAVTVGVSDAFDVADAAGSLVEVANDQFGFFSAASHAGDEAPDGASSPKAPQQEVEARLSLLEVDLAKIRETVSQLPDLIRKTHASKPAATAKPDDKAPKAGKPRYAGLDPGVLAAARAAGVPEAQLEKVAGLVQKQPRMQDIPAKAVARVNVLSDLTRKMKLRKETLLMMLPRLPAQSNAPLCS